MKGDLWLGPALSHWWTSLLDGYLQPVCGDTEASGKCEALKIYSTGLYG